MAWYDVECEECKETFRVQLYGKSSARQWKLDTWTWVCDDCKAKGRQEAAEKAAADATEMGLPELTGSPKQIAWAETIRVQKIEAIEDFLQKEKNQDAYAWFQNLCAIPESRFWIDNRFEDASTLIRWAAKHTKPADDTVFEQDASAEATLRPIHPVTETIAKISIVGDTIEIRLQEKREDFREIVKFSHFFSWTGSCWARTMRNIDPDPAIKAAEIGTALMASGFPVRIFDDQIRADIIAGRIEPENTKIISARTSGNHKGKFAIRWRRRDGDYYADAKRLPGSRYDKPDVVVPSEHFEEVMDFGETEGFRITAGAYQLADAARTAREQTLVVDVDMPDGTAMKTERPTLEPETYGIAPELADDV